jgi:tetratricopeptide (TPR) repeat protein
MKPSPRITLVASTLLLALLAASVVLLRHLDTLRAAAPVEEVLYITSPKLLKRMSLGYDGLLADVYWTRAIQYFGEHHHRGAASYALLAPLLEITTALDPHLITAYDFGANFLAPAPPDGAGLPDRALKLVQHGIESNPDNWKLYYQLGFIYYLQLKDYARAADAFDRGSKVPNAHPFMKVLASEMAQHAGDSQMARALWTTTYNTTNDKQIRANAVVHLRALQSDDTVVALESLAAQFRQHTGHFPASFNEMIASGLLQGIPVDPAGHSYELLPQGKIQLRVPDDLPFIEKGLPPGYKPLNRLQSVPKGS